MSIEKTAFCRGGGVHSHSRTYAGRQARRSHDFQAAELKGSKRYRNTRLPATAHANGYFSNYLKLFSRFCLIYRFRVTSRLGNTTTVAQAGGRQQRLQFAIKPLHSANISSDKTAQAVVIASHSLSMHLACARITYSHGGSSCSRYDLAYMLADIHDSSVEPDAGNGHPFHKMQELVGGNLSSPPQLSTAGRGQTKRLKRLQRARCTVAKKKSQLHCCNG